LVFTVGIERTLTKFWEESADIMRGWGGGDEGAGESYKMMNFPPSTGVITMDEMDRACGADEEIEKCVLSLQERIAWHAWG
jgi:hypothetical protein